MPFYCSRNGNVVEYLHNMLDLLRLIKDFITHKLTLYTRELAVGPLSGLLVCCVDNCYWSS